LTFTVQGEPYRPAMADDLDLVVVGSGGAAMAAGIQARSVGAKVVLVERGVVGGTCLNAGCVPSKTLLTASGQRSAVSGQRSAVSESMPCTAPSSGRPSTADEQLAGLGGGRRVGRAAVRLRRRSDRSSRCREHPRRERRGRLHRAASGDVHPTAARQRRHDRGTGTCCGHDCDCRTLDGTDIPRALANQDTLGALQIVSDADGGRVLGVHAALDGGGDAVAYAVAVGLGRSGRAELGGQGRTVLLDHEGRGRGRGRGRTTRRPLTPSTPTPPTPPTPPRRHP